MTIIFMQFDPILLAKNANGLHINNIQMQYTMQYTSHDSQNFLKYCAQLVSIAGVLGMWLLCDAYSMGFLGKKCP
jgi:hypothetical protein